MTGLAWLEVLFSISLLSGFGAGLFARRRSRGVYQAWQGPWLFHLHGFAWAFWVLLAATSFMPRQNVPEPVRVLLLVAALLMFMAYVASVCCELGSRRRARG